MAGSNKKDGSDFGLFAVVFSLIFGFLYGIFKIFQSAGGESKKVFSGIARRGLRGGLTEDQIITSVYAAVKRFQALSDSDAKEIVKTVHDIAGKSEEGGLPLDDYGGTLSSNGEKFIDYAADMLFAYQKTHRPEFKRVADIIDEGLNSGLTEDLISKKLEGLSVNPPTDVEKEKIRWIVRLERKNR